MNFTDTLGKMLEAAAGAAQLHWQDLRTFAEVELKRLAEAATWLEADYLADRAAARLQEDPATRAELERKAKLRAELGFDSLRLAAEGAVTMARADLRIAAQSAINAAINVLREAINESIGIAIL